jgi:hypothetical protein
MVDTDDVLENPENLAFCCDLKECLPYYLVSFDDAWFTVNWSKFSTVWFSFCHSYNCIRRAFNFIIEGDFLSFEVGVIDARLCREWKRVASCELSWHLVVPVYLTLEGLLQSLLNFDDSFYYKIDPVPIYFTQSTFIWHFYLWTESFLQTICKMPTAVSFCRIRVKFMLKVFPFQTFSLFILIFQCVFGAQYKRAATSAR